jgi:hypothetical protein
MMVARQVERAGAAGSASAVAVLLALVDEGFDRRSWHGTNLRGALRGVTPPQAMWRPGRQRHNIWELATHAAYWKYAVRRRLRGEKRGRFAMTGSNFFPAPTTATTALWRDTLALLTREHRTLRDAIVALDDGDLARPVGRGRDTVGGLVRGIAAHDLYHAGQIQLIKRLID